LHSAKPWPPAAFRLHDFSPRLRVSAVKAAVHKLAQLDHRYLWHPFTQMQDWLEREPIVITSGHGALLRDVHGREYLDANSSIWTNLHGHNHPALNAAITAQLKKIAHSSALGFANEPASLLAEKLILLSRQLPKLRPQLAKVFFSDDGSTAMEVALKLAYEFTRRSGRSRRPRFLSLGGAYHGDTVGAVSVGHIDPFHKAYSGLLFKSDQVPSPNCYRCPFNRAQPERRDARDYVKCKRECVAAVDSAFTRQRRRENPYAAFVVEPLIQGAAGIVAHPKGYLRGRATSPGRWCPAHRG
jgi:adenosylmethionine---8-amino-7-oxononanoate aminotransferase